MAGRHEWGPRDPRSWLLLIGIWLLAHPYAGIRHDAIFYAADALYRLDEAAFARELFFMAGSPFKASIFGTLYAAVVDRLGIVPASWVMYVMAQLLWAGAAVAWSARFVPASIFLVASPALFLLPHAYGAGLVLKLAEFQVTARSFAEPLTLIGLLLVVSKRERAGLGTLVAAGLIHPIMALPGWIAGSWIVLGRLGLSARLRTGVAAGGFGIVFLASAFGVLGFVDDAWLNTMRLRNPFILAREWDAGYVARVWTPMLVLWAASRHMEGPLRELCSAVAIAALSGLLLTVIGDSQRAAFILQAQPWRTVWLASWAAPFAALAAACQLWAADRGRGLLFAGAVPAAALSFFPILPGAAFLPIAHAATLHVCRLAGPHRDWTRIGSAWIVVIVTFLIAGMATILFALLFHGDSLGLAATVSPRELWARFAGWLLAPALLILARWGAVVDRKRALGSGAAGLLFVASFALLDARSQAVQRTEAKIASGLPELRAAVGDAEMIFWPENVALVWLALGRPSYVSMEQMAAQMFDRALSIEGRRRVALVGALGGRDGLLDFREVRKPFVPSPALDEGAIRRLCADDPSLALILDFPMRDAQSTEVATVDEKSVWVVRCERR